MPDKEETAGNTVCIVKVDDTVWRKKDRRELMILLGISIMLFIERELSFELSQ